jgi:hypothetical protein
MRSSSVKPATAGARPSRGSALLLVALAMSLGIALVAPAGDLAAKPRHRGEGRVGAAALDCGDRRSPLANEVMLFEHSNYGGLCEIFVESDKNLQDNLIGGNRASSIKVGGIVQVRLFSATGYRGTFSGVYTASDSSFGNDPIRHDQVDSILITPRCSLNARPGTKQVLLYEASNYGGYCEIFTLGRDDVDLANNVVGVKTSSIRVGSGVLVRLFAEANYGGRSQLFAGPDANLGSSGDIGHDTARSIRITAR